MASTTITVTSDTKLRLDYYKSVFRFSSYDQLINDIFNKTGMASATDIRRLRQIQHKKE